MTTAVTPTTAPKTTAVAIKTDEDLRSFLMARSAEFALIAKAAGVEAEVLVAELVGMARKNPDILKCTPESIVTFMYDCAKTGLVIGRGCFAVPVKDHGTPKLECWIGYKGARELVVYGRGARDVFSYVRFDGDFFEETLGTYAGITHKPGPNFGDMSKAVGVYAVAVISQTVRRHRYLSKAQVERLRKLNKANTASPSSPWVAHTEAMWKAKAILALCKDLPGNPRLAAALEVLQRTEGITEDDLKDHPTAIARPTEPAAAGAPIAPSGDAPVAAAEPAEFEVLEQPAAKPAFRLPNWRGHPLAGKTLTDVETADLEALHTALENAAERGDNRFPEVREAVVAELDDRRTPPAR